MKKIVAGLIICSYVVSRPVFAESNISQERSLRNDRPVTTIASAIPASNKPTVIPSGSITVESPIQKALKVAVVTPTVTDGYTSVDTGSATRNNPVVASSVNNNSTVTTTQNNPAIAVSTQSKPASSAGTQSGSGSGLPQAPAPATSPTIKITEIRPVTQGIQVSVQVSADVTAFDVFYSASVIGPWTIIDTIQTPNLTQAQLIKWVDDGKKTGVDPTKNPSGFYNVKIHTGDTTKPPVISNISIPEQGLTIDTPYYVVTYKVTDEKGVTQDKSAAYDLKSGANEIVIREKNQAGQETIVKRTIQYQTPEDALTEAQKAFRQTVINDNARFFTGVGIDVTTGFPLDYIGANAPAGGTPWTQPTSIGFYLQFLGDVISHKITLTNFSADQALQAATKTLTNLTEAQLRYGWFGLLPWLKVKPLAEDRSQIVFLDNINLSQSVATMLGTLEKSNLQNSTAIKNIYTLGTEFLGRQSQGYEKLYDKSAGQMYSYYDRVTAQYSVFDHADRLGNEVRSGVAFVVAYFGVNKLAWTNLVLKTKSYVTSNQQTVTTVAPYDGGAFQVFWNMLRAPENEIAKMKPVLWNAFVAYVDNMQSQNLPGFLSASSLPGGGYDGKIGIHAIAETGDALRDNVGSLYALGAAYLLDPAKVLSLIESVKKKFPQLVGPNGFYDAASPAGVISQNYYAIDQGSFLLGLSGSGPSSMRTFLQNQSLLGAFTDLYQGLNLNIQEASHIIPEPPVVNPPVVSTGYVENFDGKSIVESITGADDVYTFTTKSNIGTNSSSALQVDYKKKVGFPYSFMSIQTNPGTINFSQYATFRFQFKKLSAGPMSFILKFESPSGNPIEKTFNIPASAAGWQEIVYTLPSNASVLKQATKILLFADGGKENTAGSFLIDDIEFRK